MGEIIAFQPTEDQTLADKYVNARERETLTQIADVAAYLDCKSWKPGWALGGERELSEALLEYHRRMTVALWETFDPANVSLPAGR
jgi:hypothetical protein